MNTQLKEKTKLILFFLIYVALIIVAARFSLKGLDEDVFLCSIIAALYAPMGFQYGGPTFQAVSSFLATDIKESFEFLSLIPAKNYLKAVAIPLSLFLAYRLACYAQIKPWRNKTLIFLSFFLLLILSKPTSFFTILDNSLAEVDKQKEELNKLITQDNWGGGNCIQRFSKRLCLNYW